MVGALNINNYLMVQKKIQKNAKLFQRMSKMLKLQQKKIMSQ